MTMWTLTQLEAAVQAAWGPDTCDPSDLADWHAGNPARGQCGPTALVLHDVFGGELVLGEVHSQGSQLGFHWWNRLPDGTEIDLTRQQFHPGEVVTTVKTGVRPAGAPGRCQGQYELLRRRVLEPPPLPTAPPIRLAAILLADAGGALLLHHRSADALAEPDQWSLPGGHIMLDETPQQAARRELYEQTGLRVPGELVPLWSGERPDAVDSALTTRWYVYRGETTVPWPEVTLGEGQAARFVPPERVAEYNLSPTAAFIIWHHFYADRAA